jgi:hypothetical protein
MIMMKKPTRKKKKISIDDLAVMMKHGFDEMGERIFESEKRMEKRMEKLISESEGSIMTRFEDLELKVTANLSNRDHELGKMIDRTDELELRVNKIEDRMVGV